MITLASAVRAAFTLKDHILGFGNLRYFQLDFFSSFFFLFAHTLFLFCRSLVCVAVISAPMIGIGGATCLLLASEGGGGTSSGALSLGLLAALPAHAVTLLLGYCLFNVRVRENLHRLFILHYNVICF